jgi:hypothetical protein
MSNTRSSPPAAPGSVPTQTTPPASPSPAAQPPAAPSQPAANPPAIWGPATTIDFQPGSAGPPQPGLYDLSPQYPSVPLATVIQKMAATPGAIDTLVAAVQAKTGIKLPPAIVSQLLSDPNKALSMLDFTPAQLHAGAEAVNKVHQAQNKPDKPPPPNLIAGATFELSALGGIPYTRTPTAFKEIQPGSGLYTGQMQDPSVTDSQSRTNAITSEVLNRLAANTSGGSPQFTVTYKGQTYATVGSLIEALQANGNAVTAVVQQRLADFMPLYVQNSQAPGGYLDVADPVMVATGIKRGGQQAIVPASHSQLCFHIEGPDLNADVRFFQGTDGAGFHAASDTLFPKWVGMTVNDRYVGADAIEAFKVASQIKNVLLNVAEADHFIIDGYGETGVCNDSVALVEELVNQKNTAYPLLLQPKLILPEIDKELQSPTLPADDKARLQRLRDAVASYQPDNQAHKDPTRANRILASLPWPEGQEAFPVAAQARNILQSAK